MQKLFLSGRFLALITALLFLGAVSVPVLGDDAFALAMGAHDSLIVFGPKGDKVAELTAPAISQPVTVGATTFQISYGRDANDLLTAILTPSPDQPQSLHFNVMNKSVDTDKQAVVTLTFAPGQKHVTVDPGYIGLVHVNSHAVRHHALTDNNYAPQPAYRMTPATAPDLASIAPPDSDSPPRDFVPPSTHLATNSSTVLDSASPVSAGPLPSPNDSAPASPSGPALSGVGRLDHPKMFWAEPVTPLHGPAPHVASNQMMLVEVQGEVTVKSPDGTTTSGSNGTIVPSGSTVMTSDNSSAAVFMGGINSARFLPGSEAAVSQNLSGGVRKTTVDLHQGTVFSRVGRRAGEIEDYKVHTPQGVAAAHGTEFAVTIVTKNGVSYTLCTVKDSSVVLKDASGEHTFTITPGDNQVAFASIPVMSIEDAKQILLDILTVLQEFNSKLAAIAGALATDPEGVPPEDKDFYDNNKDFLPIITELLDSIDNTTTPLFTDDGSGDGDTFNSPPDMGIPPLPPPPPPGVLSNDVNNVSSF